MAIEDLKIGDRLVTRFGGILPLKWIGLQSYAAQFLGPNSERWPVCIKAGALGGAPPERDLYLSTGHALLIDGLLVPVDLLINGTSIARISGLDRIDYFHLEFEAHDCVSAQGLWAESYADTGNRMSFHNHLAFSVLYPDHAPMLDAFCAPRPDMGDPKLEAIRTRPASMPRPPKPATRNLPWWWTAPAVPHTRPTGGHIGSVSTPRQSNSSCHR